MGVLRALADAVAVGAGTLRAENRRHWTPAFITGRPTPHVLAFGESGTVDLERTLRRLRRTWDIGLLLVEGGAMLNGAIIDVGLYDEIFMTVALILIGTSAAHLRPLFAQGFARTPEDAIRHKLVSVRSAGDFLFKRYARMMSR
ncbi:MAG TPA: dihydrofolate reductase family protein [Armatimonadota bacterium]